MNRTAKCIQMLILLKNKNIVSIEELAQKLNTNPRNIREYKKELVEAGYTIHSYRGLNGGYQLDQRDRLVLPQLTSEEIQALTHVHEYLQANQSLSWEKDAVQGLEKIIAQIHQDPRDHEWLYVYRNGKPISEKESKMLYTIRKAILNNNTLEMDYQSKVSTTSETRLVDPYALIFDQYWYFLGYDHDRLAHRTYRISDQRMYSVEPTFQYFTSPENFVVTNYTGKYGLVDQKMVHYVVEVNNEYNDNNIRLFLEIDWGENLIELEASHPNWRRFAFDSDDQNEVFKQLYKLQDKIRLLEPIESKQKYLKGLKDILENYN